MHVNEKTIPAKSGAQRQAALRKRRSDEGFTEVRNVFAKPADHAKIKAFAKMLRQKVVMAAQ